MARSTKTPLRLDSKLLATSRPLVDRVYFIGAGFSAGVGYPVGNKLLPMLVSQLRGLNRFGKATKSGPLKQLLKNGYADTIIRCLQNVLERFFRVQQNLATATIEQIDEVFAGVDLAEFFTIAQALSEDASPIPHDPADHGPRTGLNQVFDGKDLYACLAAITRTCFVNILFEAELPASASSVLDGIDSERHGIVTFNWDEEVEYYLCTEFGDVAYTVDDWKLQAVGDDSVYLLLKPHGSVGWYDVGQGLTNDDLLYVTGDDRRLPRQRRRIASYYEVELPRDLDGKEHQVHECPPVITPPTYAKRFSYDEQRLIWRDMFTICAGAREFVFLGYSLPRDDFWTRAAIRCALHRQSGSAPVRALVVTRTWNGDLLGNYRSVFGDGFVERRHVHIADFGNSDNNLATSVNSRLKHADVRSD